MRVLGILAGEKLRYDLAMPSSSDDLTGSYAVMSETELLELARSFDSLTESAQAALRAEFVRRDLEPPIVDESETEPVSRRLVTLRRYRDLSEAIVVRSLLESAGVSVYLADENLVRLDWQISNFIGGIRLQVDANDEATATAVLEEPIPDSFSYGGGADFAQPHCPVCGSIDITFEGNSRGATLASLYLVGLPLPQGKKTWRCESCGARWEDTG